MKRPSPIRSFFALVFASLLGSASAEIRAISTPIPFQSIGSVAVDLSGTIYLTQRRLDNTTPVPDSLHWVFYSTDLGATWVPVEGEHWPVITSDGVFFEATQRYNLNPTAPTWIRRSRDRGITWDTVGPNWGILSSLDLTINHLDYLMASPFGKKGFRYSKDRGETWTAWDSTGWFQSSKPYYLPGSDFDVAADGTILFFQYKSRCLAYSMGACIHRDSIDLRAIARNDTVTTYDPDTLRDFAVTRTGAILFSTRKAMHISHDRGRTWKLFGPGGGTMRLGVGNTVQLHYYYEAYQKRLDGPLDATGWTPLGLNSSKNYAFPRSMVADAHGGVYFLADSGLFTTATQVAVHTTPQGSGSPSAALRKSGLRLVGKVGAPYSIALFDVGGRQVWSTRGALPGSATEIPLPVTLPYGLYLVRCNVEAEAFSFKRALGMH